MSLKNLEVAFNFTEDDLAANRTGRYSEAQAKRLRQRLYLISAVTGGGLAVGTVLTVAFPATPGLGQVISILGPLTGVLLAWDRRRVGLDAETTTPLFFTLAWLMTLLATYFPATFTALLLGCGALAVMLASALAYGAWRHTRPDIRSLQSVTGSVNLTPRGLNNMHIGGHKFSITDAQMLVLRNNHTYTAYFVPKSKGVASIEPVGTDDEFRVADVERRWGADDKGEGDAIMALKNLEVAFKFTEDDLAANRAGQISAAQVKRLQRWLYMIAAATGSGLAIGLALIAAFPGTPIYGQGLPLLGLVMGFTFGFNPLRVGFGVKNTRRAYLGLAIAAVLGLLINTELMMGLIFLMGYVMMIAAIPALIAFAGWMGSNTSRVKLGSVTGQVSLKTGDQNKMRIGKHGFNLSSKQLLSLRDRQEYTVYFEPLTHRVVSIEPTEIMEQPEPLTLDVEKTKNEDLALGDDGELVVRQRAARG